VHEALFHQREGVPNIMVMDGSKEQLLGKFWHKCCQAGSHIKQTEPHSMAECCGRSNKWAEARSRRQEGLIQCSKMTLGWVSRVRGNGMIGNGPRY
jgi:hypothetical protein